jgi:hypothetical protein
VLQATTGASGYIANAPTGSQAMILTAYSGSPDNSHAWTGQSSGAVYTPTATPATYYPGPVVSNLITTGSPTVSGGTAHWLTQSGTQKAFLTDLLPSGTLSATVLPVYLHTSAEYSNLNSSSTMQVTCTQYNGDGTTTNISSNANTIWTSSNTAIATVSSTGLVTPVAAGQADVGCSYVPLGPVYANWSYGVLTVVSGSSSGSWASNDDLDQTADWEVVSSLEVTPSSSAATQFLSVMEWGSSSFSKTTTSLVQSSAGQEFDCALIGETMACFMRGWPATFTGTAVAASGATAVYVSDLTPGTTYMITGAGTPSTATTDTAGVLAFSASGSGPITVGSGSPPPGGFVRQGAHITSGKVVLQ